MDAHEPYIRPLRESDWPAVVELDDLTFHMTTDSVPDLSESQRARFELDRGLAAFDGDLLCGHASSYSMRMTVPGGHPVPAAGVSWVSVRPTHRRQGLLTALMRRQLGDVHAAGREA